MPQTIKFWNYGEPFLHPDIFEMFNFASSKGIHTSVSTNGTALYMGRSVQRLIDSGLHSLTIGLDGTSAPVFNQYRVGIDFDKVMKGLKLLASYPRNQLQIYWQFIVMKHNEHQVEEARVQAQKLRIHFLLKTASLDMLDEQGSLSYLPQDNSAARYDSTGKLKGNDGRCSFVNSTLVINADGSVSPCCYDPQNLLNLGNVFKSKVQEIWDGYALQNVRNRLKSERSTISPCNSCSVGRKTYL